MFLDGHIEFEDFDGTRQFASCSLSQRHGPSSAGQNDVSPLVHAESSDPECQGGVRENSCDDDLPSIEQTHAINLVVAGSRLVG